MRNCPACTSSGTRERLFRHREKSRLLMQCNSCGHAFDRGHQDSNKGYESGDLLSKHANIVNFDRDLKLARTLITSFIIKPGEKVLDYGAGQGGLSLRISEISRQYSLGIDVNCYEPTERLASSIAERDPSIRVHSSVGDCMNNDFVIAKEVIEHTNNPKAFLEQLSECMKVGATLLVTCPGHSKALQKNPGNPSDYQVRGHLQFFTRKSIEALIKQTALFDFSFIALLDQYPDQSRIEYTDHDKSETVLRMLSRRFRMEVDHFQILLRLKSH